MSEPVRRSLPASTITWAALALTLCHLCLVFLDGAVQLAAPLRALRTLLSLPVFFVPGLPLALWLCAHGRRGGARGGGAVGAFTLLSIALGASLVLNFCVVDVVRSIAPPVSGRLFSLTALAGVGVLLLLSERLGQLRIGLERGLTPWPLIAALALVLGFGFVAQGRLYSGLDRYVLTPATQQLLERQRLQDPDRFKISLTSGARPAEDGWYRATADEVRVTLTNPSSRPEHTLVGFAITAPLGTGAQLVRLNETSCGAARGAKPPGRRLGVTRVPEDVLGHRLAQAVTDFSSVVAAPVELRPGDTCLALRLTPPAATPVRRVSLAEVSHDLFAGAPRLGRRLLPVPPATLEAHLSGTWYRAEMRRSNAIEPHMLLWGYFAQFVMEQLAGDKDQAVGVSFLLFCLLSFFAVLVMVGAADAPAGQAGDQAPPWRSLAVGLLLLGPLFVHLYGLTYTPYGSFAFPDAAYTFFIVAAVAMLIQRNRVGFILLGCLGAFARLPGAYVLAVALIARLALYKDDRAWTRRTLLWALVAGLVVVGLLLAHYHATIGVRKFFEAAYFEVFPEHFAVLKDAAPAWFRVLCFFCKLALLSSFTLLLWPLVRGPAGKLLIVVTLGYAVTLMAVHVPHLHYFPILTYCTAAAGLRAVALRDQLLPMAAATVLVMVGTGLALVVDSLLSECLGCFGG